MRIAYARIAERFFHFYKAPSGLHQAVKSIFLTNIITCQTFGSGLAAASPAASQSTGDHHDLDPYT
jgi:hypothetical protein